MKIRLFCLFFLLVLASPLAATLSSTNYRLSVGAIAFGTGSILSTSYSLRSAVVNRETRALSSSGYDLREGFFRASYYGVPPILAPIVTTISPSGASNEGSVSLEISGANFTPGAVARLKRAGQPDITASQTLVVSAQKITCTLDLTGAAVGLWTVEVVNPDGRSGSLPSAFNIGYPPPLLTSITPNKGSNRDSALSVTVRGRYFRSGANLKLLKIGESDITAANLSVIDGTRLTALLNLTGKTVGYWDLVVENDDRAAATLPQAFIVEAPELESVGQMEVVADTSSTSPLKSYGIGYQITKDSDITVNIFNIRGERVWSQNFPAGTEGGRVGYNQVTWDSITAFNEVAASGVYFVQLTARVDGQLKVLNRTRFAVIR